MVTPKWLSLGRSTCGAGDVVLQRHFERQQPLGFAARIEQHKLRIEALGQQLQPSGALLAPGVQRPDRDRPLGVSLERHEGQRCDDATLGAMQLEAQIQTLREDICEGLFGRSKAQKDLPLMQGQIVLITAGEIVVEGEKWGECFR